MSQGGGTNVVNEGNTLNIGDINVYAQPGQDGEQIANEVFAKIRQKEARLGIRT